MGVLCVSASEEPSWTQTHRKHTDTTVLEEKDGGCVRSASGGGGGGHPTLTSVLCAAQLTGLYSGREAHKADY